MEPRCKTKVRLTGECKEAAAIYTKLEAALVDQTGRCSEEEYLELCVVAKAASTLSEELRRDLYEHTQMHGC